MALSLSTIFKPSSDFFNSIVFLLLCLQALSIPNVTSKSTSSGSNLSKSSTDGSTSTIVEGDVIITSETSDCPCSNSISQQFAIKRIGGKKGDPIVITKRAGSCCDKDSSSSSSSSSSMSSPKLVPVPVPVPVPMYRPYFYHPQPAPSQFMHHHMLPYSSIPMSPYPGSNYPYMDRHNLHSSHMSLPLTPQHHYPPPPPPPPPPPALAHPSHHLIHPSSSASQQTFWTSYENRPFYSDPSWSFDGSSLKSTLLTSPTIQDKKSEIDYDYDPFPSNMDIWD